MRRLHRVLATLASVTLVVSACGGGGGSSEPSDDSPSKAAAGEAPARGDADLVIWTDDLKIKGVRKIADGFSKDNGISVDVQSVSDLQANFITANSAGNGPDVVVGANDWIGNMVQNGAVEPLQLTPDQVAKYSPIAVDAMTYQDQTYGVPYGVEALVLYRNTDLAPDEPATLEDAFATGQAAVDAGTAKSPFNLQVGDIGDAYHMQPLYTSMGGYIFGKAPDGSYDPQDLGVGKPGSLAAAQKIYDIGEAGSKILTRSISDANSIALFSDGQAPFLVSGPWARKDLDAAGISYAVQPVPGFAGAGPAVPFTGVQGFYVASQGKNKAFAQEYVTNTMTTEEAMRTMFDLASLPPALTSLQQEVSAADPTVAAYIQAAENGEVLPAIPAMAAVFEPMGKAYAAIVGGADPTSTMEKTGQTLESSIKDAG